MRTALHAYMDWLVTERAVTERAVTERTKRS